MYRPAGMLSHARHRAFLLLLQHQLFLQAQADRSNGRLNSGHCGATDARVSSDCAHGSSGAFSLTEWGAMGDHVPSVLGACLQMCANCARCRFISLSVQWRDCSWYWSCPTVHRAPSEFYWTSSTARLTPELQALTESGGVCFAARRPTQPLVLQGQQEDADLVGRALAKGRLDLRPERLLWIQTINPENFAECIFALLSALTRMHMSPGVLWRPMWPRNKERPHAAAARQLLQHLLDHLWRDGMPTQRADEFHQQLTKLSIRRAPLSARARCYAGPAAHAHTFTPLQSAYAFHPAMAAYDSFRTSVRRHLGLPLHLPAHASQPRAMLWQRRSAQGATAGREILNEGAVLAAMRGAGFTIDGAVEPHRLPLAELVRRLGDAKLLVSMHGAALVNAAFMQPNDGVVLEVFPPGMAYGSGFELCSNARLLHLSLFLRWAECDTSLTSSDATFRRSAFARWQCTAAETASCSGGGRWSNNTMADYLRRCEADVGNWFDMGICRAIARSMDAPLPLGPLRTLLQQGARYLRSPPSLRPALHGHAALRTTTAAGPGAGVVPRCPRALLLEQPKFHITPAGPTPTQTEGNGNGRDHYSTSRQPIQARRLVPSLLRSLGFCVRVRSSLTLTATDLVGTSLLLSRETPTGSNRRLRKRLPIELPRTALWVRIFSSTASNATQGLEEEEGARIAHSGPQLHGFCEPSSSGASGASGGPARCVVDERLLRTP